MRYLHAAAVLLLAYAAIYFSSFPNNLDTVSHLGTVMLTSQNGFDQYTSLWYLGSPILVVYILGFWLVHGIGQVVGPVAAYALVDALAVAGLAYACWRLADAMGLKAERKGLMLLLFIASYGFFYSWLRVDRFPTLVGGVLAVLAIESAMRAKNLGDWRGTVATGALLGLSALASLHTALIAGVAAAWLLLRKSKAGKAEIFGAGAGALVFAIIVTPLAMSLLEFRKYVSPAFSFEPHTPVVALSWLGPLFTTAIAWLALRHFLRANAGIRRAAVLAIAVGAAGLFYLMHWGQNLQQFVLIGEFVAFLLVAEFAGIFQSAKPRVDFALAATGVLIAAGLSNSFLIPFFQTLNPVVYVLFAALFAAGWLARNWEPKNNAIAIALIVISVPFASLMATDYAGEAASKQAVTAYLAGQSGFGRVLFAKCPYPYFYSAIQAGKPAAEGVVFYTNLDPAARAFESSGVAAKDEPLLTDSSYQVRWIVDCVGGNYAAYGASPAMLTNEAVVWEKPGNYSFVQGATYDVSGNSIALHGTAGTIATIFEGYYPSLECRGCEFVEAGTHEMKVRLLVPDAAVGPKGGFFALISFSVLIGLLALLVVLKK
jgi:hypothetical protein